MKRRSLIISICLCFCLVLSFVIWAFWKKNHDTVDPDNGIPPVSENDSAPETPGLSDDAEDNALPEIYIPDDTASDPDDNDNDDAPAYHSDGYSSQSGSDPGNTDASEPGQVAEPEPEEPATPVSDPEEQPEPSAETDDPQQQEGSDPDNNENDITIDENGDIVLPEI